MNYSSPAVTRSLRNVVYTHTACTTVLYKSQLVWPWQLVFVDTKNPALFLNLSNVLGETIQHSLSWTSSWSSSWMPVIHIIIEIIKVVSFKNLVMFNFIYTLSRTFTIVMDIWMDIFLHLSMCWTSLSYHGNHHSYVYIAGIVINDHMTIITNVMYLLHHQRQIINLI